MGSARAFSISTLASASRSVATLASYQDTEGLLLHSDSNAPRMRDRDVRRLCQTMDLVIAL
jgi:hypothetical protein